MQFVFLCIPVQKIIIFTVNLKEISIKWRAVMQVNLIYTFFYQNLVYMNIQAEIWAKSQEHGQAEIESIWQNLIDQTWKAVFCISLIRLNNWSH